MDIGGLYDCLIGIYEGKADVSILEKYDEVRREKYSNIVDPISSENIRRLFAQDPERALETDEFLQMCKKTETDTDFSKQFQLVHKRIADHGASAYILEQGINMLRHDFTQYYTATAPKSAIVP